MITRIAVLYAIDLGLEPFVFIESKVRRKPLKNSKTEIC
jgi:hypothetical protein